MMKGSMMIFRLAFLVALVVGLGGLFGFYPMSPTLRDVHIVSGLIMLIAIIWVAVDLKDAVAIIAALLVLAGGVLPLVSSGDPVSIRIFHLGMMVVAVGLAEISTGRALRVRT